MSKNGIWGENGEYPVLPSRLTFVLCVTTTNPRDHDV